MHKSPNSLFLYPAGIATGLVGTSAGSASEALGANGSGAGANGYRS